MSITLDGTAGISSAGAVRVDQITDENGSGSPSLPNGLVVGDINYPATGSLSNRNKIINGGMRIDQRNAGASLTIGGSDDAKYPVDRFFAIQRTDGTYTAQRVSTAPGGFNSSVQITVTTADTSLGATQFSGVFHNIEGFNTADLGWGTAGAQTVTLSFWVRSSLTGTFGGSLRNSAVNRAYPFSYTISAANTWEYKTITIDGDTSGTWLFDNGIGIRVTWSLGVGSNFLGTAGAWTASDIRGVTGETSVIGTSGATWQITGVQLEAGAVATPFEHRSFGQELALCERYYQQITGSTLSATRGFQSDISVRLNIFLSCPMRAAPTVSALGPSGWNSGPGAGSISLRSWRYAGTSSTEALITGYTASAEL